jgi:hypothetical protein
VPNYTTNTAVNDFAMQFRATESNTLTFTDFEIDTNYMTLSSWVNIGSNYPTQDFNPLISQQGVFEYGINSNGKTYVKLLSFDPTASFISSIGEVVMDDSKVTINTITTESTAFHLYALASTYPMAKAEVMSLMDAYATSNVVHYQNVSTVPTTIASINLTEVFDANNNIFDIESVNSVNVYVSGRAVNTPYVLGNLNEFFKYTASFENTKPKVLIESTSNLEVGSTVLTMDSATVFGSSSAIEKYYMFAFLQNDGFGTIGSDSNLLTDEKLQAFITNADFVTDFDTLVANGAVYFDNTGVPLNEVKHITNATVTKAFTDVTTYTTGSAYVNMVDTNFYSFALVASDLLDNVTTAFKRHYMLYKSLTDPQYIVDMNAIVVEDTLKVDTSSVTTGAIVTNFEIQFTVGEVYHFEWDFGLLYPENPSYTSANGPHGGFSIGENMTIGTSDYRKFAVTGNNGFYIDYTNKKVRTFVTPEGNTTNLPMYSSLYPGYTWYKYLKLEVLSTTQIRLSSYETSDRVGSPAWTGIMGTNNYSGTAPTADSTLTIGLWQYNYGDFYMTMGNFYHNTISAVLTTVSAKNRGITISGQVSGSMTVSSPTVTYYALATTTELTNAQVISLVHANKTVGDALYDGLLITVKTQVTETLTDVLLPNVLDTSSGTYVVKPSTTVNAAYVYLYGTNGSVAYDNIDVKTILPDVDMYVNMTDIHFRQFENDIQLSGGTVFSTGQTVTKMYEPLAFADDVDLEIIDWPNYILVNSIAFTPINVPVYKVSDLPDKVITHFIKVDGTTELVTEDGKYQILILVEDNTLTVGIETLAFSETPTTFNKTLVYGTSQEGALGVDSYVGYSTVTPELTLSDQLSNLPSGQKISAIYTSTGNVFNIFETIDESGNKSYYCMGHSYQSILSYITNTTSVPTATTRVSTLTYCTHLTEFINTTIIRANGDDVKALCIGSRNVYIHTTQDKVYGIGINDQKQLANGYNATDRTTFVECSDIVNEKTNNNAEVLFVLPNTSSVMVIFKNKTTGQQYAKGWGFNVWNGMWVSAHPVWYADCTSFNSYVAGNTYEAIDAYSPSSYAQLVIQFRKIADGTTEYRYSGRIGIHAGSSTASNDQLNQPCNLINDWITANPSDEFVCSYHNGSSAYGTNMFIRHNTDDGSKRFFAVGLTLGTIYANYTSVTELTHLNYTPGDAKYTIDGVTYEPVYFWPGATGYFIGLALSNLTSLSTLRTILSSSTTTPDGITFTGSVIADEANVTTYYALATTTQLTNEQVRTFILANPTNTAYTTATVVAGATVDLTDVLMLNVLDTSSGNSGTYIVEPSTSVNAGFVYLYATDGETRHDDIDVNYDMLDRSFTSYDVGQTYNTSATFAGTITSANNDTVIEIMHAFTADHFYTTGISIDVSASSIGDVYEFDYYLDIPDGDYSSFNRTWYMLVFGTIASSFTARDEGKGFPVYMSYGYEGQTDNNGNAIDGTLSNNIILEEEFEFTLNNRWKRKVAYGGVAQNSIDFEHARYFVLTVIDSDTSPAVSNPTTSIGSFKLEAFTDNTKSQKIWTILDLSKMNVVTALTSQTVFINIWVTGNAIPRGKIVFGNFQKVYGSGVIDHDLPYATIREVAPPATNDLTLVSGSVFSSVASITKYYVVAFVTSAPSGSVVDTSTIDETTIASFITSLGSLTGTGYKTLLGATGTNMYYNEDGVAQYEVENIANVTVASAFTTLAPTATNGSEMVDITTTTGYRFIQYVIAVDTAQRYGFGVTPSPFGTSLIDYTSLSRATRDSIGSGWTQIKYLPGTSTSWFPGDDNLKNYGGTEFLFTTGDFSHWLIADQSQVNGEYYTNAPRTITRSSLLNYPHTRLWYNRDDTLEDPLVSLEDHTVSVSNRTMMYGENNWGGVNSIHSTGMYVFVR